MTRDEAIEELADIEPREEQAWAATERIIKLRDLDIKRHQEAIKHILATTDESLRQCNSEWMPLYNRKRQLRAYLDISG